MRNVDPAGSVQNDFIKLQINPRSAWCDVFIFIPKRINSIALD